MCWVVTTLASPLPDADPFDWRIASRRAAPLAIALALHGGVLALLLTLPPAVLLTAERVAQTLEVRFYTVSGDNAETDAPLIEPPLADAQDAAEAPAPVVLEASTPPLAEAEPSDETPAPADPIPEAPETDPAATVLTAPGGSGAPAVSPPSSASAPAPPPAPGEAVSTTQLAPPTPAAPVAPPRFADILARAEDRLDPQDFQIVLQAGGVSATIRESLCLSSSQANLEAGDCPEGPNPNSPDLARYGLTGLAEAAPEFLEDLTLTEFELRQLGANPSQIQRIMVALRAARREAIETPGVLRAMQQTQAGRTDNLGVTAPITPEHARDPSGEP